MRFSQAEKSAQTIATGELIGGRLPAEPLRGEVAHCGVAWIERDAIPCMDEAHRHRTTARTECRCVMGIRSARRRNKSSPVVELCAAKRLQCGIATQDDVARAPSQRYVG